MKLFCHHLVVFIYHSKSSTLSDGAHLWCREPWGRFVQHSSRLHSQQHHVLLSSSTLGLGTLTFLHPHPDRSLSPCGLTINTEHNFHKKMELSAGPTASTLYSEIRIWLSFASHVLTHISFLLVDKGLAEPNRQDMFLGTNNAETADDRWAQADLNWPKTVKLAQNNSFQASCKKMFGLILFTGAL